MLKKTKAYIKSAPQYNATSLMVLGLAADNAARTIDYYAQGNTGDGIKGIIISALCVLVTGCLQIFAAEHYGLYKMTVADLEKGWDERIIAPMMKDWCTRQPARCAAYDSGYKKEYKEFKKRL